MERRKKQLKEAGKKLKKLNQESRNGIKPIEKRSIRLRMFL
jgi:hypothetical protein